MATSNCRRKNSLDGRFKKLACPYRAPVRAARKTGKPQIVSTHEVAGFSSIERVFPVKYLPDRVPRSLEYWRECDEAEHFLHGLICTPSDWRQIEAILANFPAKHVREGRLSWGTVKPGQEWEVHSPTECQGPSWRFLEKQRGNLRLGFLHATHQGSKCLARVPWDGALLVTEIARRSRRGRPALKHDHYDLAAAYVLTVRTAGTRIPRGLFPALARHLSMPWFDLCFSANELKKATHEVENELRTAEGVVRNEYSARVQWGDHTVIAVLHTHLPPHRAALLTPEYQALTRTPKSHRIS
jgi:hypothetical protein